MGSLYSVSNSLINYFTNLYSSVNFSAYYRVWNNLLIGANASIGTGVILENYRSKN